MSKRNCTPQQIITWKIGEGLDSELTHCVLNIHYIYTSAQIISFSGAFEL